ncbi:MAG TPA: FUSC family protein, partial [Burkholderiaceae bacterium]|nr:FUSC family protein [Burkholderiaceae bacterium]
THTDYATLRRRLPDSDILVFARDALQKLAINVAHVALNIARNRHVRERNSVKAELRAIEYELEKYRQEGMADGEPEIYALLVQILRRLRNATRLVDRLGQHLEPADEPALVDIRLERSLDRFLSRQTWRLGMLTSNLRLDSPHFRYAVRVAVAALLAMTATLAISHTALLQELAPGLGTHSYWVILTILVVMKPGFALTRQRNGWRLGGTLIGCGLALLLFRLTDNPDIYMAMLVITCVLGYSLIQLNFMASAIFNTLFVLLIFHFLSPAGNDVISERLVDTLIGCGLALLCSYVLPWWEHRYMPSLARALLKANTEYLRTGLAYAALTRARTAQKQAASAEDPSVSTKDGRASDRHSDVDAEQHEAELRWRLARKNVYIAFGNFASAFNRMMDEPIRRQNSVPELNNVLIQNHVLASQISAAIPVLASLPSVPDGIRHSLDAVLSLLQDRNAEAPSSIETEGELATLAYPLRQMVKAAQLLRQEMRGLNAKEPAPARQAASSAA